MRCHCCSGRHSVGEGDISALVEKEDPGGHPVESFSVGGESFHYGSGWDSIVFNSAWNRGYIHDDAQVRITRRGVDIVRVEVK